MRMGALYRPTWPSLQSSVLLAGRPAADELALLGCSRRLARHLLGFDAMPKIIIYTTPFCPYCLRAKRLLAQKGALFEEIDVSGDWQARAKLTQRAGGLTTVPQIWIGETHIGGCDELYALDRVGRLDPLLAG
jgi:glutaredoxin 3